jgi:hypothetical protein
VCLAALGMVNWTFLGLLNWTIEKTTALYNSIYILYFLLLIPLFWGTIWGVFKISAIALAALLIPVSPEKKFSLYTLGILSLINCLVLIVYFWSRDVNFSWRVIVMTFFVTIFVIDFSTSIVLVFSKKEVHGIEE